MSRKYLVLFLVTATVVVLDQWSKFVVVRELTWRMDSLSTLGEQLQAMYSPQIPVLRGGYFEISRRMFAVRFSMSSRSWPSL